MDHQDVRAAVAAMVEVLGSRTDEDWAVPAGPLEWSCRQTAAHIGHDLLAYAGQVAARPPDAYLPFDLHVRPTASPSDVVHVAAACGELLASALATADHSARAWHWGACGPEGFAAMGVAEILLHTHDITCGWGVEWRPPARLCAAVLGRLFPEAPPGEPVHVLLWCTGRADMDGLPRRTSWTWKAVRGG
jgi:mycothiol maleylpyruvate isomerase-like protein